MSHSELNEIKEELNIMNEHLESLIALFVVRGAGSYPNEIVERSLAKIERLL